MSSSEVCCTGCRVVGRIKLKIFLCVFLVLDGPFLETAARGARAVLSEALRVVAAPLPPPLRDTCGEKYSVGEVVASGGG
jgi:hypothetical protein